MVMMPLTMADPGVDQLIKKVGGREDTRKFLENLGFVAGEPVKIISKISGNVIIEVKGTRIALDRTLASKIHI